MESTIPSHFLLKFDASANAAAVVPSGKARFTVITPRMIRMEWAPVDTFEERASQAFWFRNQPVPPFSVQRLADRLEIDTGMLRLVYVPGRPFADDTLSVEVKELGVTWHFGDSDPGNLGGTARTLDGVDGPTPISAGLVSRSGWSVVDDSASLLFNDVGWLEARNAPDGQLDFYFLGYGHDYLACLREFNMVSGSVPMIPRYVLGNWWSRYWAYNQQELTDLMLEFEQRQVPLSVCIIDMDWHITRTGNTSSGWTGYTWNRELFPDPEQQLRFLHEKNLKVALNLHPASGVHPHEEMYAEMARAVGQDPTQGEPVEFDITNPRFVNAYFQILHHPQEARGVDFWWMDWQQGMKTRLSGAVDPLWWLNHLHFLDLGRDGQRRSFIFSRWGGLGNHRYPIGFSGDTVISWASLAFQPFFTATASNVNYGWWSHDIGGHMGGIEDSEMYTRWVQMGVFLPVLRLHSTANPYLDRRPWGRDEESFHAARQALQLRHAMIPYLYSQAWRYHRESIPPLLPMYYAYPEVEEAYACPNQYLFGDQLLVAPFITPQDTDTRLSRAVAWLPEGAWFNFFNGQPYESGWHAVYGTLRDIPVFARAGAIVPQGPMVGVGGVETPDHLIVNVFPGADGRFDLYEDEGNTNSYLDGQYAITPMRQHWGRSTTTLMIGPAEGETSLLPAHRTMDVQFRGFVRPGAVTVRRNGEEVQVETSYHAETRTLVLVGLVCAPVDQIEVILEGAEAEQEDMRSAEVLRLLKHFRMNNDVKVAVARELSNVLQDPRGLGQGLPVMRPAQLRALLETITGAGLEYTDASGEPLIVLWNNHGDENVTHQNTVIPMHQWARFRGKRTWTDGTLPHFQAIRPKSDFGEEDPWVVLVNYYGLYVERRESTGKS